MEESTFQSKCPKCGNTDILNEEEVRKAVHCQNCYYHYSYKINHIKSRILKDSNGMNDYTDIPTEDMDWIVEQAEKVDELISIALWSIRRLPSDHYKRYALTDLKKVVGDDSNYSTFIQEYIDDMNQVIKE